MSSMTPNTRRPVSAGSSLFPSTQSLLRGQGLISRRTEGQGILKSVLDVVVKEYSRLLFSDDIVAEMKCL